MKLKALLKDFNLLATTSRGNERPMCFELSYLLKEELGDPAPLVDKTGIRGLVAAKTAFDPCEAIQKLRAILQEHPYKFRYALRIIPVERVLPTVLDEVKHVASELAADIGENETFRVTVEKLENPDKILLIEVVGGLTGMALIKPNDILAVVKEKML